MKGKGSHNKIRLLQQKFNHMITMGMPMDLRLFFFLIILVITFSLGSIAILIVTGTFTAGLSESEKLIENELLHVSERISQDYGQLSMQAVEFSKSLSKSMEEKMAELGISPRDLQEHPKMLEEIIANEFQRALFSLQVSKSSGVFFILDATVNPSLDNAKNSRAGLYLKNMEPNIVNSSTPSIILLRGFPSIGRKNDLSLHSQWQMEFDISNAPYFHRPINAFRFNQKLPLSRLYYWSPSLVLPGTSEEVMLCSVPIIDSNGNVFGVCGFEVSAMLFKLSYMPNRSIYNRLFFVLSPTNSEVTIDLYQSMFAGGYLAKVTSKDYPLLKISGNNGIFNYYKQSQGPSYLGIHRPIHLYPKGSAFYHENWMIAAMLPEEDVINPVTRLNLILFSSVFLLFIIGVIVSFILSKKFIKPISEGFDIIKSSRLLEAPKTKIPEIDDLIDFLIAHNEELHEKASQENLSITILDEFLENTKALSPAERSVFNLYVKGYTAKEIADLLCLSINTIKTHNKHIYSKLNVGSREELLVYVNMLKEIGRKIE